MGVVYKAEDIQLGCFVALNFRAVFSAKPKLPRRREAGSMMKSFVINHV